MRQIKYTTSYYGENESRDGGYVFKENATRKDKRDETWMSGVFGLMVGFGQLFRGLFIDLPVTYHTILRTEVLDSDEGRLFSDEQNSFPAVQDPPRVRLIVGSKW